MHIGENNFHFMHWNNAYLALPENILETENYFFKKLLNRNQDPGPYLSPL